MNKITLIVDVTNFFVTQANTGIQRVLKEFLKKAIKDRRILLHVIYYEKESKEFLLLDEKKLKLHRNDIQALHVRLDLEKKIFMFDTTNQAVLLEIDRVWNESHPRKDFYAKLNAKNIKIVNIIYDLIPLLKPECFYEQTKINFPTYLDAILTYSSGVVFNSMNTKEDFYKIYSQHKRFDKISQHTIPLGCNISVHQKKKSLQYNSILESKFILFVGTIEPRKKHMFMLQAFDKLVKLFPQLHLVFIGAVGWNVEETMQHIDKHPLRGKNFFHFQDILDDELVRFYQKAYAVCYFSDYEGYGLPVVEALYYENIVFTSQNSSLIEIGKKLVEYAQNEEELVEKITKYLNSPLAYKKRKRFLKKQTQDNSWIHFYEKILRVLFLVVNDKKSKIL